MEILTLIRIVCQRIFGITFFWTRVCSDWFVTVLISKNDFRIYFPSTREASLTTWALRHRWFNFEGKGGQLKGRSHSPLQSALWLHDRTVSSRRLVTPSKLQRTSSQSHQIHQRACCTLPNYFVLLLSVRVFTPSYSSNISIPQASSIDLVVCWGLPFPRKKNQLVYKVVKLLAVLKYTSCPKRPPPPLT